MIRSADARAYTEVARGPSSVKDDRPVSLHAAGGRDEADAVHGKRLPVVLLAALGIVFGDIGTSPLYTMREAFGPAGGLPLRETAVLACSPSSSGRSSWS